jgi:hypothetical protein
VKGETLVHHLAFLAFLAFLLVGVLMAIGMFRFDAVARSGWTCRPDPRFVEVISASALLTRPLGAFAA